jgi:hypothetical protein
VGEPTQLVIAVVVGCLALAALPLAWKIRERRGVLRRRTAGEIAADMEREALRRREGKR